MKNILKDYLKKMGRQMEKRETNQIMRWKKDNLQIHFLKNVLRQLLFLEIVSVMKTTVDMYEYKMVVGVHLIKNSIVETFISD